MTSLTQRCHEKYAHPATRTSLDGSPAAGFCVAEISLATHDAQSLTVEDVFDRLNSGPQGLSHEDAASRVRHFGPNVVATHKLRMLTLFMRQIKQPLFGLLGIAAALSFVLGERTDTAMIAVILVLSVGLGFFNEYRAQRTSSLLHSQVRQLASVKRDGNWMSCELSEIVPGDVVRFELGHVVPADVRLIEADDLECDESILTGESAAAPK